MLLGVTLTLMSGLSSAEKRFQASSSAPPSFLHPVSGSIGLSYAYLTHDVPLVFLPVTVGSSGPSMLLAVELLCVSHGSGLFRWFSLAGSREYICWVSWLDLGISVSDVILLWGILVF